MDIVIIVMDQKKAHEGVIRPFISFAKALEKKYRFSFLLFNCTDDFSQYMRNNSFQVFDSKDKNETLQKLKDLNPDLLFTDDDFERLKFTQEISKKIKAKTITYVQILYGSHSIVDCFDHASLTIKEKIRFTPMKYVPFSFFRSRYIKSLRNFDLVVANSKITATFLHSLYNIGVSGIVYPPVDTDVFQPNGQKTQKEITIFLGSHLGDTNQEFARKIIAIVTGNGYIANLFGNGRIASQIIGKDSESVFYHSNISDKELAQMYSKSKLTVCPQKWEQFGLVPVESLSCGTPVLAFNCMGFQETISKTNGWLANNDNEFLQMLQEAIESEQQTNRDLRNTAINEFSIQSSGSALEKILEKYINQKT